MSFSPRPAKRARDEEPEHTEAVNPHLLAAIKQDVLKTESQGKAAENFLLSLLKDNNIKDLAIICGKVHWGVHDLILRPSCSRLDLIRNPLSTATRNGTNFAHSIVLKDVNPVAVEQVLLYLYTHITHVKADAKITYARNLDKLTASDVPLPVANPKLILVAEMATIGAFLGDEYLVQIFTRKFRTLLPHFKCEDIVNAVGTLFSEPYRARANYDVFRELVALYVVREKYDRAWHMHFGYIRKAIIAFPEFGALLAKVDELYDEHAIDRRAARNFKEEHIDD